jgi:hypothetical protein
VTQTPTARTLAVVAALALVAAACASGTGRESGAATASTGAEPTALRPSFVTNPPYLPGSSDDPGTYADPSDPPAPTLMPVPSGPAPSPLPAGAWTGFRWVQGPQIMQCGGETDVYACDSIPSLFGWSRGYSMFFGGAAYWSTDGLQWHAATKLDVSSEDIGIVQVEEGPRGLLAVARSGQTGLCADHPIWIQGLWTSPDGKTWSNLDLRTAFGGGSVYEVSGGPRGYLADGVAADGMTTAVWFSLDARTWRQIALPEAVMSVAEADQAVAFANGFAFAAEKFRNCRGIDLLTAAVWRSGDGVNWTQGDLPGSTATLDVGASLFRAGDHGLLAILASAAAGSKSARDSYWTSPDGTTWKKVSGPALKGDAHTVVSFGGHALVVSWTYNWDPESAVPPTILTFNATGNLVALKQSGTAPNLLPNGGGGFGYVPTPNWAFGPSGLIVCDGESLWIGLPTVS